MSAEDFVALATQKMDQVITHYNNALKSIRTGRVNTDLLDHIQVDYYGVNTPINQLASITVSDVHTLKINPWDKKIINIINKAISQSKLDIVPVCVDDFLLLKIPSLTEERRKQLVKQVKTESENFKVAIRNARRDVLDKIKNQLKDKLISEDIASNKSSAVDSMTDKFIKTVDTISAKKEAELLQV